MPCKRGGNNIESLEFQESWLVLRVCPLGELPSFIRSERVHNAMVSKYSEDERRVWGMRSPNK